jgi:iron complex outermembrane receptor protein
LHPASADAQDFNLFGGFGNGPGAIPPDGFPGNGIRLTDINDAYGEWSAFTPHVGIEWHWSQDALAYASIARGFKSGGFNGRANEASNPDQREPYNPEFVWTYEIGSKTSWYNQRLFLNLSLFYNDYTDLQLASFVTPDNGQTYLPLFTNAGKAVTRGFEFGFSVYPISGLELHASVGYTDAMFKEYIERDMDVSGERSLANTPKWTAALALSYSIPLSRRGCRLKIGGNVNYQDERFLTVSNLPDLLQPAYTIVNAYITLESPNRQWWITIGCKNLTDARYLVSGLDGSSPPFGIVTGFFGDPRTWSITYSTRF